MTTPTSNASSGSAAKAARRFRSRASRTRSSCETAAPRRGVVEVATLALLYGVYEVLRGQADATLASARAHTEQIVGLERELGVFVERPIQDAAGWLPGVPTL